MDDLINLIRRYRLTDGLTERLRLGEMIFHRIAPDLWLYVISRVPPQAADDVLQEILKAIATSLKTFRGDSETEFWAWCYTLARYKISDQLRGKSRDRMVPTSPDELWQMMETTAEDKPITAQTRHDLDHAIKLLTAAKPECVKLLWRHFVVGLDYGELAEELALKSDAVRMKVTRCLEQARTLVS